MSWQSGSINPATTSPLADISRIKNDLSVLKGVLGGTQDADVPFTPYAGTAARIVGDFSNATLANRVMFQTSVANSETNVAAIPNGTNQFSRFTAFGSSDPANASLTQIYTDQLTGLSVLRAAATGSGSNLPLSFNVGGYERMRIDTGGQVGVGGAATTKFEVFNGSLATRSGSDGYVYFGTFNNAAWSGVNYDRFEMRFDSGTQNFYLGCTYGGTGQPRALNLVSANQNVLKLDTSFNTTHINPNGGLGYGTGAGGTVTQSTSKSTAVTLNKPCGQITMNNAALAAGASVFFTLNNSLMGAADSLIAAVSGGSADRTLYRIDVNPGAAGAVIKITNTSGGSLSEAVVINFAIIKGATA